jgi:hypothetical protein
MKEDKRLVNVLLIVVAIGGALLCACCLIFWITNNRSEEIAQLAGQAAVQPPEAPAEVPPEAPAEAPPEAPAEAANPTPTNTQVVPPTGTPTPTSTPKPTFTPKPSDTPTPTVSPEVQLYILEVVTKIQTMGEAMEILGALMLDPHLDNDDWVLNVATQMAVVQLAHEELTKMDVPPEMAETHALILDATGDCNEAMDYLVSGVDNLDAGDLAKASELITLCEQKMQKSVEMMAAEYE